MEAKSKRGGKREGSGRPKVEVKKTCHTITFAPDEWDKIVELAKQANKTVSRFLIEAVLK